MPRQPAAAGGRRLLAVLAGAALGLLSACSINPPLHLAGILPGRPVVLLPSVPFYPQQDYQCGPAALAGVLAASGVAATPAALAPQVYLPGREGSLQLELVAATRRAGRIAYRVPGEPAEVFAQLQAGRPVLVFQNVQTRSFPVWHYAVLVGYDTRANEVYLNSGGQRQMAMGAPGFLRTWDWAGRWALVALRPGELPALPRLEPYIDAVAAYEAQAGATAATPAWRAARRQWPRDARPYLALGNTAYASGNLPVAIDYYRRGLRLHPGNPALANNLASVLGELGCPGAATTLLEPVQAQLAASSQWRPVIAATLAELPAARPEGEFCAALYPGDTTSGLSE